MNRFLYIFSELYVSFVYLMYVRVHWMVDKVLLCSF